MLSEVISWPEFQILNTAVQILQKTEDTIEPDFDCIELSFDEDAPEWMIGDEKQNNELTMIGQVMIGLGIFLQFQAFIISVITAPSFSLTYFIGLILSSGMAGLYVWALLKWFKAREFPTALTTFRSWKVNFFAFWFYVGATAFNIFNSNSFGTFISKSFFDYYSAYIGVGAGAPLIVGGIFLGWRIKQIWFVYDPERSLAFKPFQYVIWEDEEPTEKPKEKVDTTIVVDTVKEEETIKNETDNTNSMTDTIKTDDSNTKSDNNSSSTTTTNSETKTGENTQGGTTTQDTNSTSNEKDSTTRRRRKSNRFAFDQERLAVAF